MFSRIVGSNNFVNEVGDGLFPNISGCSIKNDWAMLTVMRALLGTRTTDKVGLVYHTTHTIDADDLSEILGEFKGVIIRELSCDKEDAEAQIKELAEKLGEYWPGFSPQKELNAFWEQKIKSPAFFCTSEEKQQTIVFVHGLTTQTIHMLAGVISRLLPWYFVEQQAIVSKGKVIVDAPAVELVSACSNKDPEKFNRAISALYERYDFRNAVIRSKLNGFENVFHKEELEGVKNQIEHIRRNIESLNERFREEYQKLDRQTTLEAGLIEKIKRGGDGDNEIMDLFLTCKNLHLQSVDGSSMTFVVATTINNFDPYVFEQTIKNDHSFWYRTEGGSKYSRDWSDEQIEKFFKAVFEDEILKIKVCAAYTLDFGHARFRGISGYNYGPEFANHMPNQHIHQFGCIGSGHEAQLREAMLNRNYMGAINVCIASAGNMSMQEVPTGEHHMKYLLSNDAPNCVILPDGREVTPKEALAWLEEKEGADHE